MTQLPAVTGYKKVPLMRPPKTMYRRQIRSNLIVCGADEATSKLIHSLPDLIVKLNNKGIIHQPRHLGT
ncbi:Inorganic pyrophosphatase [Fusarium oxysporum f. sp. albedinis]|nr:Inorganic pyrophosphatase [Fusarium oxysporum f. sp. albedinis]